MRTSSAYPLVSVIMPAYNAAAFVSAAIESVLAQTFREFELLVIEDGSTDATGELLRTFHDPRLVILPNERNLGLVTSLNRGIAAARGEYIARMDADDWSYPGRLALQVTYLEQHPEIGILSCAYQVTDKALNPIQERILPETDVAIRRDLYCKYECFCHPAVMLRRIALPETEWYRHAWFPAEDRDLWLRILEVWQGANLPHVLHKKRDHVQSISNQNSRIQSDLVIQITVESLKRERAPAEISSEASNAAWARGALFIAFGLAMREPLHTVIHYLDEAVKLDCSTAQQSFEELLVDRIAIYMHNYDADIAGALALVSKVFEALPSELSTCKRHQTQMEARIYEIAAFHSAQKGEQKQASKAARRALRLSNMCFRNRGLLKLALGMSLGREHS
jgi:glycosyltransferase involved in cell wall biosynthesis